MGITRLADLTGLDRIGVPVFAAIRPNSRSVATSQGKGLTADAARAGALMEAVERWHAESIVAPMRLASATELRVSTASRSTGWPSASASGSTRSGRSCGSRAASSAPTGRSGCPTNSCTPTTGCHSRRRPAASRSARPGSRPATRRMEAVRYALCELIERDAVSLWHQLPADRRPVDRDRSRHRRGQRLPIVAGAAGRHRLRGGPVRGHQRPGRADLSGAAGRSPGCSRPSGPGHRLPRATGHGTAQGAAGGDPGAHELHRRRP